MRLEFTLWYVGAVVIAEVTAAGSIWFLHYRAGTEVDRHALSASLGLVTFVALLTYALAMSI